MIRVNQKVVVAYFFFVWLSSVFDLFLRDKNLDLMVGSSKILMDQMELYRDVKTQRPLNYLRQKMTPIYTLAKTVAVTVIRQ